MVQRTSVKGISRQGRPAQGVRVMNLREEDQVSAVALVMETSTDTSADVQSDLDVAGSDVAGSDGAGPDEATEEA